MCYNCSSIIIINIIIFIYSEKIEKKGRISVNYLDEINELWEIVKTLMSENLSSSAMNLWFGDIEIVSFNDNTLKLTTGTEFKKKTIEERFMIQLKEKFNEVMGFEINIEIGARNPAAKAEDIKRQIMDGSVGAENSTLFKSSISESAQDDIDNTFLGSTMPTVNFEYTFENFIVGNSNKFAHAACIAVADKPAQDYNPLFIYGPSGLGKTHLLYAVTNEIKKKNPDAKIIYIKGEDFTNQLIDSISRKSISKFRDKYRTCDVLLIDDIQFIEGKMSTQEEFFHTFNALYEDGKQIILASDRPPKDIERLEERIRTRFEWGLIADIQPPDLELRVAIFKNKLFQAGIGVSDDIIVYLAENLRSNIRQIEGAVKKLVAIKFFEGGEITKDVVKSRMSELLGGAEPIGITIDKIFAAVEKKYGISKAELTSKSRVKEVAQARHVTMYLIKTVIEMSYPNIGKLFERDHSTVMNSIDVMEKKISSDAAFELEINNLIKEIKE